MAAILFWPQCVKAGLAGFFHLVEAEKKFEMHDWNAWLSK